MSDLSHTAVSTEPDALRSAMSKAAWRLVPFLSLLYLLNIMDRTNLGFARLTMQKDLKIEEWVFDWGYGIFYFGYLVFEVPANLLLRRVGARRWMARIMITWGLVSCATMAVTGPWSFFSVRILLGVAEAGFFPGIVLYLTYWFPARERAKMMALFMTGNAVSGVISNPISGAIMQYLSGRFGLSGWQWLFLLEGLPSVLIGIVTLFYLADGPAKARWLTPDEQQALLGVLQREEKQRHEKHGSDLLRAVLNPAVWLLIIIYFTVAMGANASGARFPEMIHLQFTSWTKQHFPSDEKFVIGLLAALPHLCAVVGMILLSRFSDYTGARRQAVAICAFIAAGGWALSEIADSPWLFLVGLCLAQAGMISMLPNFWVLPTTFLSGAAAAGGIALINSIANLGGLIGPRVLGVYGSPCMGAIMLAGGALALCVRHDRALDQKPATDHKNGSVEAGLDFNISEKTTPPLK
ncbi:MAG TPA: MFS transporter [Gemmataceae bacterium]|nr:MFS transporter [Gemmataceae bacterium]